MPFTHTDSQKKVQTTLIALGIGAFAIGTDAFVAIGLVNEIAQDVGESPAVVGQIVSVFALSYAIFAPIAATFMANIPDAAPRVSMLAGTALASLHHRVS
jgi:predicted MFS family arabinose efflux permease